MCYCTAQEYKVAGQKYSTIQYYLYCTVPVEVMCYCAALEYTENNVRTQEENCAYASLLRDSLTIFSIRLLLTHTLKYVRI
jgi:hypothetical protein